MTMPRPQAETRPKEVEISFWLWIGARQFLVHAPPAQLLTGVAAVMAG